MLLHQLAQRRSSAPPFASRAWADEETAQPPPLAKPQPVWQQQLDLSEMEALGVFSEGTEMPPKGPAWPWLTPRYASSLVPFRRGGPYWFPMPGLRLGPSACCGCHVLLIALKGTQGHALASCVQVAGAQYGLQTRLHPVKLPGRDIRAAAPATALPNTVQRKLEDRQQHKQELQVGRRICCPT